MERKRAQQEEHEKLEKEQQQKEEMLQKKRRKLEQEDAYAELYPGDLTNLLITTIIALSIHRWLGDDGRGRGKRRG